MVAKSKSKSQSQSRTGTQQGAGRESGVMSSMFEQGTANVDRAMREGVRIQEEAGKWWSNMLGKMGSMPDMTGRAQASTAEAIDAAQRASQEYMAAVQEGAKSSMDLWRKAMEAGMPGAMMDAPTRLQEIWQAGITAMQKNTQAAVQANAKAMEAWTRFVRRSDQVANETAREAAAATR